MIVEWLRFGGWFDFVGIVRGILEGLFELIWG